ncbi:MAG: amidohydrolase family protein [Treponema sp.]
MNQTQFTVKGDFATAVTKDTLVTYPHSYVLCAAGKIVAIVDSLSEGDWESCPCFDFTGKLIIPGSVDLHVHAPQYAFRGMGMELELIDWLNTYTFKEEAKYADAAYALENYRIFANDLAASTTCRAVIFGTIHTSGNAVLASLLQKTGIPCVIGKVNMDRNAPEYLCETTAQSLTDTEAFIRSLEQTETVDPIITPRFVPSCTAELMAGLGSLAQQYNLPIQSHLSENKKEIEWVQSLHPDCKNYAAVYEKYGLLNEKTIMAHCVHPTDEEIDLLVKRGTYIAHCPESNMNLTSGIAPIARLLDAGVHIGLGSDVAAASQLSLMRAMVLALQLSKMRKYFYPNERALSVCEALYLGTKGGGSFFGNTGSFEKDFWFDAVVLDDSGFSMLKNLTIEQRLERALYLCESEHITAKFVRGNCTKQ